MNKKLDVPLIRQEKDTHVCVLASLSMILQYHGWDVSIADLERDEDAREGDLGAVGTYLLKHDFDAEVVMFHPRLFTLRDRGLSRAALAEHFQARLGHDDNMQWDKRGGRRRHERKDYMFGIHMATHGNFNNGYLLKVKPR